MPIPVLSFPYKTLEQTNPEIYAGAAGADLLSKAIANQRAIAESRYVEPELSEKLSQLRAETEIKNHTAQYTPQMLQAELQKKILESPKMQADIDNIYRNQIPLGQAHTNYYNTQTSLMPGDAAHERALKDAHARYYEVLGSRVKNNLDKGTGITGQILNLNSIKDKYGENSWQYKMAERGVLSEIGLKEGRTDFMTTNLGLKFLPDADKEMQMRQYYIEQQKRKELNLAPQNFDEWSKILYKNSPGDVSTTQTQYNAGNAQPQSNNATIDSYVQSPLDYKSMARTAEAAQYRKSGEPSATNDAIQMKNAYAQMSSYEPKNLAIYAGAGGTLKYLKDVGEMLKTGKAPNEEIAEFQNFKDVAQMIIQDAERAGYKTSVTPQILNKLEDQLKSLYSGTISPDVALRNYHTLKDSIKDYAIQKLHVSRYAALPLTEDMRKEYEQEIEREAKEARNRMNESKSLARKDYDSLNYNRKEIPIPKFDLSEKNIKAVAERHGMTTDEVREYIKRKGLK